LQQARLFYFLSPRKKFYFFFKNLIPTDIVNKFKLQVPTGSFYKCNKQWMRTKWPRFKFRVKLRTDKKWMRGHGRSSRRFVDEKNLEPMGYLMCENWRLLNRMALGA